MNRYKDEILKIDNIDIPQSDTEAYVKYDEYNIVYNKLEIAKIQKLNCNPLPCLPNKYPIVSKPIINLYGMGLNSKKINNKKKFYKELSSNNFWCDFLEGDHISWDFIIRKKHLEHLNFGLKLIKKKYFLIFY